MLIPPNVIRAAAASSRKDGGFRYAFNAIHVEREAGRPLAVSTDGATLTAVRWDETAGGDYPEVNGYSRESHPEFSALIPQKDWLAAAKMVPKRSTNPALANVLLVESATDDEPESVIFAASDGTAHTSCHVRCVDGRFPRWRSIVPAYRVATAEHVKHAAELFDAVDIDVDPRKLMSLMQSAVDLGLDRVTLAVPVDPTSTSAMQLKGATDKADWQALLMPLERRSS